MKHFVIGLVVASLVAASGSALAGGYGHHGHYHYKPRHHHYGGHHYDSDSGVYLLGGVLLGSVLTNAYYRSNPPEVVYVERRPYYGPRVIYREPAVRIVPPVRRSLLRDLQGNCFETTIDEDGSELREQIPAAECDW